MSEEVVLICARVAHLANPVAGSVMKNCKECDESVWVSSDAISKVIVAHNTAPLLICLPCAMPAIEREGLEKIVAETKRTGIGSRIVEELEGR